MATDQDNPGESVDYDLFNTDEIFERVSQTAEHEFQRTPRMLLFSGMAAGFSISLSFLSRMALGEATHSPGHLPGDLLYPIGFIVVVLGRYQLFTENTLTPVTLVQSRMASVPALLRLWGVVLVANTAGAVIASLVFSIHGVLAPEIIEAGREVSRHSFEVGLVPVFVRGIMAGSIVASMVWVIHAVRDSASRVLVTYGLMLMIPIAGLFHCVTGAAEATFGVVNAGESPFAALGFFVAVTLGNVVGGVALVATINYGQIRKAQLVEGSTAQADEPLGWRQWLVGYHIDRSRGQAVAPELEGDTSNRQYD